MLLESILVSATSNTTTCPPSLTGITMQGKTTSTTVYYPAANLGSMVKYWYLENENYDYHSRQCDGGTICEHYLNVSNDIEAMVHGPTEEHSCQMMVATIKANFCHFSFIVDCLGTSV